MNTHSFPLNASASAVIHSAKAADGGWQLCAPDQPCERALCRAALNLPAGKRAVSQQPLHECSVSYFNDATCGLGHGTEKNHILTDRLCEYGFIMKGEDAS